MHNVSCPAPLVLSGVEVCSLPFLHLRMIETVLLIWFLCLLVVSIYQLVVFRSNKPNAIEVLKEYPSVSIVISVKNGTEQLKKGLTEIIQQDYPVFEVIIVDDHSDGGERMSLEKFISSLPQIKLYSSTGLGKKQALTSGIENARYDYILCTDADCIPATSFWIKSMIELNAAHGVVIGYSPYLKLPGFLNQLIRFETVMTGIQYLSWAMEGRPYMAVGRNILYPRALFLSSDPFTNHRDVPYGDDDLGMQAISNKTIVAVNLDSRSYMVSAPATTWTQWLKQKHRHLSAGHYYRNKVWWQPGLYGLALIGHWFLLPFIISSVLWWIWIPAWITGIFIRWQNYFQWTKKLGDKDTAISYPILEIVYAAYLAFMGAFTVISKKKTWN